MNTSTASRAPVVLALIDLVAIVISLALVFELAADTQSVMRPISALVFLVAVPGWSLLRLARAPITTMTIPATFVLSVAFAMITSMMLVAWFDWAWRSTGAVSATACASLLGFSMVRDLRPSPTRGVRHEY